MFPMERVFRNANVFASIFCYVQFFSENVNRRSVTKYELKTGFCVHDNKDSERESFRTDAAVVSHMGFRMPYSVACAYGMVLAKADIHSAYTQSGEAKREVFVKPPFQLGAEPVVCGS